MVIKLIDEILTYERLLLAWIGAAPIVAGILLFREEIPRGSKRSNQSGWAVNTRVGWVLKEAPGALQLVYWFFRKDTNPVPIARIFLAAYAIHYIYRIFIYPLLLRTGRRKNITVENLFHTFIWHFCNEGLIGYWLTRRCNLSITWLYSWQFIAGWILFSVGLAITISHDAFLIALRRKEDHRGSIRIPEGGLFEFVANGNFFGECVEWLGFAIMTWSLPGFAFFLWTCANLIPTAVANDRWYRRTMKDKYPKDRKAIIPFLL